MRKLHLAAGLSDVEINEALPRAGQAVDTVLATVKRLVDEVKNSGETALREHAKSFDGVAGHAIRVSKDILAESKLDAPLAEAVAETIARVRKVSQATLPKTTSVTLATGANVTTRFVPIDSVGVYVPGGKAVYPSSVIMNVVPAQVAGVKRIALASPPQSDGRPHPTILATAELLGIDEVYAIGGAGAVAAFAYGVPSLGLDPVRTVTGPGNIFVATAKRVLRGIIGIDSEAGPTEIMILADSTADADLIVADLISQAEHDENAAAVLVTDSDELAEQVLRLLPAAIAATLHRERVSQALGGVQSAVVVAPSWESVIAIANAYATEHLEIHSADPQRDAAQISNAGAVFLGKFSPVSLGDYLAGSNHVLPTGQQAKFGPGLGVHTFLRPQQVIDYQEAALLEVVDKLVTFANAEGLPAHGTAAKARFSKG